MTLAGFKSIFWFEYLHRLLGRLIGVLFFIPMLFFFSRYPLPAALKLKLLGLFLLGGAQGLLGWYMVKSGLVDKPYVSQYRLVAHLSLALLLYAAIMWTAFGMWLAKFTPPYQLPYAYQWLMVGGCLLVFITIIAGGFVAGTKAGFAFNTFPLMNGRWLPEGYWALSPLGVNLFENPAAVQFNHRLLATLTSVLTLVVAFKALKMPIEWRLKKGLQLLIAAVLLQYALGVATLLLYVPTVLAALHQMGAVLLLTASLLVAHLSWRRP